MTVKQYEGSTPANGASTGPGELGIDTGGTFTNVIARFGGALSVHKVASTSAALGRCFGIGARLAADVSARVSLNPTQARLDGLIARVRASGVQAVAINLLLARA